MLTRLIYRYVDINRIWDRISKVLICLTDAALNVYFSRAVKNRLVRRHGLVKYARVASFTDKLMVVSVLMDVSSNNYYGEKKERRKCAANMTLKYRSCS